MKGAFILFLLFSLSSLAFAQNDNQLSGTQTIDVPVTPKPFKSFEKQTTVLGISFGFGDWNKQHYKMPDSSRYGSGSMSLPIYFSAERAVAKHMSVAAGIAYDIFYYNYSKEGYGNGNPFYRPQTDKVRIISPSLALYYHFNKFFRSPNLDVFLGIGGRANYLKHNNYPSGDSVSSTVQPDFNPMVKLGVRYYLNRNAAFYGDLGYDRMSFLSLGFSFRLYGKILSL